MQLDLSDFHPLDHSAFAIRCARYPGGFWRHVKYWALYQYQFPWEAIYHKVRCARDQHDTVPFWVGDPPDIDKETLMPTTPPKGEMCRWCFWRSE